MSDELDSGKTGLKTAIAELHDPSAPVPGASNAEQLPLLPLPFDKQIAEKNLLPRGAGRPPGAKNKNTEQWRDYLLARYASPLEGLAQTMSLPIEDICKMLSCTKLEAFKLQIMAMKELAPYVHQKMPLAIEAGEGGLINLVMNVLPRSAAALGNQAESTIIEVLNEPQQNQILSADDIQNSNAAQSNANGQATETAKETTDATR